MWKEMVKANCSRDNRRARSFIRNSFRYFPRCSAPRAGQIVSVIFCVRRPPSLRHLSSPTAAFWRDVAAGRRLHASDRRLSRHEGLQTVGPASRHQFVAEGACRTPLSTPRSLRTRATDKSQQVWIDRVGVGKTLWHLIFVGLPTKKTSQPDPISRLPPRVNPHPLWIGCVIAPLLFDCYGWSARRRVSDDSGMRISFVGNQIGHFCRTILIARDQESARCLRIGK